MHRSAPARMHRSTVHGSCLLESRPQMLCTAPRVWRRQLRVQAQQRDPPDAPRDGPRGGREWLQSILSRFGPITQKPNNTTVLDFEKPLMELDKRIREVRSVAEQNKVDVSEAIKDLEARAKQLRKDTYTRLTPVQRLQVARHPNRPTFLDIALNISDKFVELHGDRAGLDDPAIVCGLASIDGQSFMFVGHQKGRNTKENIHRNFGMPQPNGYRKALRFMRHADKHGFPIITFVDTPGAYAGKKAEELGQGEAIAVNLREMFSFRVPVLSVVIGEGGSGGALAIGCANRSLIMEHSVYYVASPEACAAILWKSRDKAATATEALKITAPELRSLGVMDHVIPEPLGGAHSDPMGAFPAIKKGLMDVWAEYSVMSEQDIQLDRYAKFRKLGDWEDHLVPGGRWRDTRALRQKAMKEGTGVKTKAGTWAVSQAEADMIEAIADADEAWDARMTPEVEQWLNRPTQPPGLLRTGLMEFSAAVVQQRRLEQLQAERGPDVTRQAAELRDPVAVTLPPATAFYLEGTAGEDQQAGEEDQQVDEEDQRAAGGRSNGVVSSSHEDNGTSGAGSRVVEAEVVAE